MKKWLFFLITTSSLSATTWFPGENIHFQPTLPKEFILASRAKTPSILEGVYWGSPLALKAYFARESPLPGPIIVVRYSTSVHQKGAQEFTGDAKAARDLKILGGRQLKMRKSWWGEYPILIVNGISQGGDFYYLAYIGLNQPDGKCLMLTFLPSSENNRASEGEFALWDRLLSSSSS